MEREKCLLMHIIWFIYFVEVGEWAGSRFCRQHIFITLHFWMFVSFSRLFSRRCIFISLSLWTGISFSVYFNVRHGFPAALPVTSRLFERVFDFCLFEIRAAVILILTLRNPSTLDQWALPVERYEAAGIVLLHCSLTIHEQSSKPATIIRPGEGEVQTRHKTFPVFF